jgi:hypothetical protein
VLHEVCRASPGINSVELIVTLIVCSYDLELDKKLSEETTVLVENYTVRSDLRLFLAYTFLIASIALAAGRSSDQSRIRAIRSSGMYDATSLGRC